MIRVESYWSGENVIGFGAMLHGRRHGHDHACGASKFMAIAMPMAMSMVAIAFSPKKGHHRGIGRAI